MTTLLAIRGSQCRARLGRSIPPWLDDTSETTPLVVRGRSRAASCLPAEGLVLVTEEEVFGARAHRQQRAQRGAAVARPFLEDLRSLERRRLRRPRRARHRPLPGARPQGRRRRSRSTSSRSSTRAATSSTCRSTGSTRSRSTRAARTRSPRSTGSGGSTFATTKVAGRARPSARWPTSCSASTPSARRRPGIALPPVNDDYRAFEATFPFDETPDQARAIDDVERRSRGRPPDGPARVRRRRLRQDRGRHPRGVPRRDGRQAGRAALPDDRARAAALPRARGAARATTPSACARSPASSRQASSEETLALSKDGSVDVVVGTHRLLSKDVHLKDLGLLVVDEEQRFGVAHKERIKQLKAQVDVLTLSATPIPRTLQMAVSGLRDLSLITTPPVDRRAVRTIVTRFDDQVDPRGRAARAVARRAGLLRLQPHRRHPRAGAAPCRARSRGAHRRGARADGRGERTGRDARAGHVEALERVMLDFVEGRYDVLVATAIVESGLDIPRANTILIDRADCSVSRSSTSCAAASAASKERAYCYLIVPPPNAMTDEARAAHRSARAPHRARQRLPDRVARPRAARRGRSARRASSRATWRRVGFDLFCQMLEEAVHEMRGETVVHDVDPELSFDVTRCCPRTTSTTTGVRLSLYKRLASADDEAHVRDLAAEMEDRFGAAPGGGATPCRADVAEDRAASAEGARLRGAARSVTLHLREDTPLDPKKVTDLVRKPQEPLSAHPRHAPVAPLRRRARRDGERRGGPRRSRPLRPGGGMTWLTGS